MASADAGLVTWEAMQSGLATECELGGRRLDRQCVEKKREKATRRAVGCSGESEKPALLVHPRSSTHLIPDRERRALPCCAPSRTLEKMRRARHDRAKRTTVCRRSCVQEREGGVRILRSVKAPNATEGEACAVHSGEGGMEEEEKEDNWRCGGPHRILPRVRDSTRRSSPSSPSRAASKSPPRSSRRPS